MTGMLDSVEWGEFALGDLFEVQTPKKRFDANKITILETGEYPYVVRSALNNGIRGYLNEDAKFLNDGNTISFGQDTATVFYQKKPYFTGDKIKVLKPKAALPLTQRNAQFMLPVMTKSFSSFAWGSSSFKVSILEKVKVWLPVKNGQLALDFMENFVAELEARRSAELEAYLSAAGLKDYALTDAERRALNKLESREWREFRIGELFERITTKKLPYKAKDLPKEPVGDHTLPCLTSSFVNQGLNYYVPVQNATVLSKVISIPSNSDVYRAYFQSRKFTVLSDAYAIRWMDKDTKLSNNQYLFAVSCINEVTNLSIYSYKNKLGGWKIVQNKNIVLPISNGEIDFSFMDIFISALKKLVIKDVVQYADRKIAATQSVIGRGNHTEAV